MEHRSHLSLHEDGESGMSSFDDEEEEEEEEEEGCMEEEEYMEEEDGEEEEDELEDDIIQRAMEETNTDESIIAWERMEEEKERKDIAQVDTIVSELSHLHQTMTELDINYRQSQRKLDKLTKKLEDSREKMSSSPKKQPSRVKMPAIKRATSKKEEKGKGKILKSGGEGDPIGSGSAMKKRHSSSLRTPFKSNTKTKGFQSNGTSPSLRRAEPPKSMSHDALTLQTHDHRRTSSKEGDFSYDVDDIIQREIRLARQQIREMREKNMELKKTLGLREDVFTKMEKQRGEFDEIRNGMDEMKLRFIGLKRTVENSVTLRKEIQHKREDLAQQRRRATLLEKENGLLREKLRIMEHSMSDRFGRRDMIARATTPGFGMRSLKSSSALVGESMSLHHQSRMHSRGEIVSVDDEDRWGHQECDKLRRRIAGKNKEVSSLKAGKLKLEHKIMTLEDTIEDLSQRNDKMLASLVASGDRASRVEANATDKTHQIGKRMKEQSQSVAELHAWMRQVLDVMLNVTESLAEQAHCIAGHVEDGVSKLIGEEMNAPAPGSGSEIHVCGLDPFQIGTTNVVVQKVMGEFHLKLTKFLGKISHETSDLSDFAIDSVKELKTWTKFEVGKVR
jgi:hypothetical protein